ncbi:GntR family transcriptional regulator [Oceaniradius stylonematis]|uniref:GntR family transcriptional regulator n=1 Tax=Oceaniradius stylonematis TaxID=2184161 RepID=UPI00273E9B64|nr:GntR family transcriptional regulator [Oceaniradius stylonematis]
MRQSTIDKIDRIRQTLTRRIEAAEPGEKLPTVKTLMRTHRTAQRTVEQALRPLLDEGRLRAQPGLGLIVADPDTGEAEQWEGDLLVLYRISDSRLARSVLQEMEQRLKARGHSVLQIGYSSEEQAVALLGRLGRFKACLIQIHFEVMSIELLAELQRHARAIIVDGVSATGIDADAIGTNWREALSIAFRTLQDKGHERIGFLTSGHEARQIAMARREFELLCRWLPDPDAGRLIAMDKLPGATQIGDITAALGPLRDESGKLPFTALIAWGIVEGFMLERALTDLGQTIGDELSVLLLGSTDFPSEHVRRFDVIGNSHREKLDLFERIITERIAMSGSAPTVHYLPIGHIVHGSVVPPDAD